LEDVMTNQSPPLTLPKLINTKWGNSQDLNIFKNQSCFPSARNNRVDQSLRQ
jgi:hypothetical protein